MAKAKIKTRPSTAQSAGARGDDPLIPALDEFSAGDYPAARRLLAARVQDPDASESEQNTARRFLAATRLERGALSVALACLGLYALVIMVAAFKQP